MFQFRMAMLDAIVKFSNCAPSANRVPSLLPVNLLLRALSAADKATSVINDVDVDQFLSHIDLLKLSKNFQYSVADYPYDAKMDTLTTTHRLLILFYF